MINTDKQGPTIKNNKRNEQQEETRRNKRTRINKDKQG